MKSSVNGFQLNEDTVNEEQLGTALVAELDVAAKLVEESAARIAALLQGK